MDSVITVIPPEPIAFTAASLIFIVAAFQGLMLSAMLWFARSSFSSSEFGANRLLSALLLTLGVLLADHAAEYTGYYYYAPYMMELVVPLHFLIGPLLWGYVKVQTTPAPFVFRKRHLLHLLPALLQLLVVLPFVLNNESNAKILYFYESWFDLLPFEMINFDPSCEWYRPWQWHECIVTLQQVANKPEFDLHLKSPLVWIWLSDIDVVALWISMTAYIGGAVVLLKNHRLHLRQLTSNTRDKDLRWLLFFIALISLAALVYIVISFQELFLDSSWMEHDLRVYVTYTIIAISVIYLGVLAIRQPIIFTDELELIDAHLAAPRDSNSVSQSGNASGDIVPSVYSEDTDKPDPMNLLASKYQNSPLTNDSALAIRASLEKRLIEHKDYLEPELTLKTLSDRLDISPHILSQVINESIGVNFFDCINGYRLKDVKRELQNNNGKPIIQIAMDAGFNSKSSFYGYFKRREDMTPSAWRKKYGK